MKREFGVKRNHQSAVVLAAVLFLVCANLALGQTERTLHVFGGPSGDGANPTANLTSAGSSVLYGTTIGGGAASAGTVFQLSRPVGKNGPWTETVLYSFTGVSDGGAPYAGLTIDATGALYGTTSGGGVGCGTVFKLTPPSIVGGAWIESVLYLFTCSSDGGNPYSNVVFDKTGALYGTTYQGGQLGAGTVYKLAPPATSGGAWTESVLYSFGNQEGTTAFSHGCLPRSGVILSPTGALYGTTRECGLGGGVVYKLSPPAVGQTSWIQIRLHTFAVSTSGPDGYQPDAGVTLDEKGNLYGSTDFGGASGYGMIYELTPPSAPGGAWAETIIHSFPAGVSDGAVPFAGVVIDKTGALYGTCSAGGLTGLGTVYKLAPPATSGGQWSETVLYNFPTIATEGENPNGGLLLDGGILYGTTEYRGGQSNFGTVYEVIP